MAAYSPHNPNLEVPFTSIWSIITDFLFVRDRDKTTRIAVLEQRMDNRRSEMQQLLARVTQHE